MDDFARRIGDLLAAGKKIEAIKELREVSGLGLADAKAVVDAVEARRPVPDEILARLQSAQSEAADDELPADVRAAAQRGNRIEAIKLLRQHTGLGLREARDRLDRAVPVPGGKRGCLLPLLFGCGVGLGVVVAVLRST